LKPSFQPKAKVAKVHVDPPMAVKVSKNTIRCTHLDRMIRNPNGPATLKRTVIKYYTSYQVN